MAVVTQRLSGYLLPTMTNPPEEYFRDKTRLLDWMQRNPTVRPDGSNGALRGVDLSGIDLHETKFHGATLDDSNLAQATLTGSHFGNATLIRATLHRANLDRATIQGAHFLRANLTEATFVGASCRDADLQETKAAKVVMSGANLEGADLRNADFKGANLSNSMLKHAHLEGCDLRGANLYNAELTRTAWRGAKIDASTKLDPTIWRPEHDAPNDGADELSLPWSRRHVLNWETIRGVGRLPLFAGSYSLFILSLTSATAINWLNESAFVRMLQYPIPMPARLIALLVGSALLATGSTLFEVFCPARVKEFSRKGWVYELRRSGVEYWSDSLQRPFWMSVTSVFVVSGGGLVGLVFFDRLIEALAIVAGSVL